MDTIIDRKRRFSIAYKLFVLGGAFLIFMALPGINGYRGSGSGYFAIEINGRKVGVMKDQDEIERALNQARRRLAAESKELVMVDLDVVIRPKRMVFGRADSAQAVADSAYGIMTENIVKKRSRAYTVKINEFTVNLKSSAEVRELLRAAKEKYDPDQKYEVELILDPGRELNALTANMIVREEITLREAAGLEAGAAAAMAEQEPAKRISPQDFEPGLQELSFGDVVEVVEAYVPEQEVTPLAEAIELVTKNQEKDKIYEVASGDTLSQIAEKNDTTIARIIEMNENIQSEDAVIRAGDEITVTVPEPELAVVRREEIYYEENYNAPVEYLDNDAWYTSKTEVRQDPVAGYRKVISSITYRNDTKVDETILYEEVTMAAVPKIVERGTKVPPSYIKPLSGGRFSSGFKARWGRMHKGVDWACPIGTAIYASSAGTVTRAGWASGYGYVVYIGHADGRQTRYGHLSKVLVKPGQKVAQGEKIALSGNTGRSTGPHVHFEILINGSQVDPLKYLN